MRRFSQSKTALALAAFFCLLLAFASAAWAADGSAIEILKDVELTAVADGKAVTVGELAKGRPFFLVFSTAT